MQLLFAIYHEQSDVVITDKFTLNTNYLIRLWGRSVQGYEEFKVMDPKGFFDFVVATKDHDLRPVSGQAGVQQQFLHALAFRHRLPSYKVSLGLPFSHYVKELFGLGMEGFRIIASDRARGIADLGLAWHNYLRYTNQLPPTDETRLCPYCGKAELIKRGTYKRQGHTVQRWSCTACKANHQTKVSENAV